LKEATTLKKAKYWIFWASILITQTGWAMDGVPPPGSGSDPFDLPAPGLLPMLAVAGGIVALAWWGNRDK
jgi:hypothetical protein